MHAVISHHGTTSGATNEGEMTTTLQKLVAGSTNNIQLLSLRRPPQADLSPTLPCHALLISPSFTFRVAQEPPYTVVQTFLCLEGATYSRDAFTTAVYTTYTLHLSSGVYHRSFRLFRDQGYLHRCRVLPCLFLGRWNPSS